MKVNQAVAEAQRWPAFEALEQNLREARRVAAKTRNAAEDAADEALLTIRRHPVRAVGAAAVAGTFFGAALGFAAWWVFRTRQ
jgi:hypothetical protein